MECLECGAIVSENDLFCPECGATLAPSSAAEPGNELPPASQEAHHPTTPEPPGPRPQAGPVVRDRRADAAFFLGIATMVLALLSCLPFNCLSPVVGLSAIVLGIMAKRDLDSQPESAADRKRAQWGIALGFVGTVLYCILLVTGILFSVGLILLRKM